MQLDKKIVLHSGMGRINCVDTSLSEECFLVKPTPATVGSNQTTEILGLKG